MNELSINKQDQIYINFAINLSKKHLGLTSSNPVVGSVLVKNNVIISTGITGENGVPHSETVAILKAKDKAADITGATLYVTLEPCCHFGKTPPCTDLIIKSKISRIVVAMIDPDNRVNGLGIKKLQEAGIEVIVGVLEDKAKELNRGFFSAKTKSLPFITLKLATSLDCKIATKTCDILSPLETFKNSPEYSGSQQGVAEQMLRDHKAICSSFKELEHSKWITSEKSRQYAHYLRAKNDAILVGANTVRIDNPMLDCRIYGLEKYSPKRIILSQSLNINLESKIIQTARQIPTFIATSNQNTKKFIDLGVNIINLDNDNLGDLVKKLVTIGINNLLIEGGGNIATKFIQANLVDRLILIKSTKIIGNDGISAIGDLNLSQISQGIKFNMISTKTIGDDVVLRFEKSS